MEGRRRRRRTELKRGNECDGTATEPDQRAELRPRTGRTVSVGGNERVFVEFYVWQKKIKPSPGLDICVEKPSLLDSVFYI